MRTLLLIPALLAALLTACGKPEAPQTQAAAPAAAPAAPAAAPTAAPAAAAPAPAAAPAAPAAPAAAAAADTKGADLFKKSCAMCHQTGVAGAPKLGDKADWAPRIAQGKDVLYQHAIAGFTGKKGAMPPKGGAASISDDDIKAIVDYMAASAQ